VAALLVSAITCGGNVVVDRGGATGTGATGTGATGTGTAGTSAIGTGATGTGTTGTGTTSTCTSPPAGDCTTDADCHGGTCAPLTPGGYLVCLNVPPPATPCPTSLGNECCTSADCTQGKKCLPNKSFPNCGKGEPLANLCAHDFCTTDAQCVAGANTGPQICNPAGAVGFPVRTCFTAYCRTDADCTAHPCGACLPIPGTCCAVSDGLACVYPGGCSKSTDCGQGDACQIDPMTGTSACLPAPPCPI
jgi:hypothetical protein